MNYSKEQNDKKLKKRNSNKTKTKNKASLIFVKILLGFVLVGVFAVTGAVIGAYVGILESAAPISAVNIRPDIFSSNIVVDGTGEVYATLEAKENREYVSLGYISPNIQNAFVAIEDARFYSHNGIDIKGIVRSVYTTVKGDGSQGGSTITQQLIKNSRGIDRNDVKSKLQEQYLAVNYEKDMIEAYGGDKKKAKDHILELYLNTIALGNNLNGVQTASNYYFNKEPIDLTISEAAVIAAITQWPVKYQPVNNPEANKSRQVVVIKYMLEQGFITQAEYEEAMNDDVYSRIIANNSTANRGTSNSYYTDQVISEVARDLSNSQNVSLVEAYNMVYNSGLEIRIPIDLEIQKIVDDVYLDDSNFSGSGYSIQVTHLLDTRNTITGENKHTERVKIVYKESDIEPFLESVRNEVIGANDEIIAENYYPVVQPQSSFVVIDNSTGYVVAINSSRGPKLTNLGLNRATQSPRPTGSTFKILASYAPGLDLKIIAPGTVIVDEEFKEGDHTFVNWYSGYRGPSTVRKGIEQSMNILAVKIMKMVGIEQSLDYLLNFGITSLVTEPNKQGKSDQTLSTSLGGLTIGVSNLENTAAYATIANGGRYRKPVFYTQVYNHDGVLLLDNTGNEGTAVIRPTTAYLLTDMMKGVLTNGTGTSARLRGIDMPTAGKTGTTSDDHDFWFEGFTPYYTAGIWLGYDLPAKVTGTKEDHKLIWGKIMSNIHINKGLAYKDFVRPEGIGSASFCASSGKSPGPNCTTILTELFEKGTEPSLDDPCDYHRGVNIDTSTGLLANEFCPEEFVKFYSMESYRNTYGEVNEDGERTDPSIGSCTFHYKESEEGVDYYVDPETGERKYVTPEYPSIFDLLYQNGLDIDDDYDGEDVDGAGEVETEGNGRIKGETTGGTTEKPIDPLVTPEPIIPSEGVVVPSETPIPSQTPPPVVEIPKYSEDVIIIDDFR